MCHVIDIFHVRALEDLMSKISQLYMDMTITVRRPNRSKLNALVEVLKRFGSRPLCIISIFLYNLSRWFWVGSLRPSSSSKA